MFPTTTIFQRDVAELIGDPVEGSIHIDETGFPKQGNHSVGVQRQYCGRLGKVDNCQVGVFLGYVNGSRRTLIDGQLYLPKDWAHNNNLRAKCKVPKDVRFRTKAEIGLDMVLNACKNGVPFGWVGMDCLGEQSHLRNKLDEEGLVYIADIPRDTRVWITMPQIGVPERNLQMLSPDVDAPSSMAAIDFQDQGIGIALQPGYEVASVLLDACEQLVL